MDYLGKGEVFTNTDLDRFVNNICEKEAFCVHRNRVQLMKNGCKSVAFIILFNIYIQIRAVKLVEKLI